MRTGDSGTGDARVHVDLHLTNNRAVILRHLSPSDSIPVGAARGPRRGAREIAGSTRAGEAATIERVERRKGSSRTGVTRPLVLSILKSHSFSERFRRPRRRG